jgi:CheY-like chemotaxis protein
VDPVQIQQVIMNLVVNAKDAMSNGGILKIETANVVLKTPYTQNNGQPYTGTCVSLIISDTGSGIDEKVAERIFEPFFTTKEIGKGTGLGLATAFGIIKQADGHICFESERGVGTTFRVFFPIVDDASLSAPSLTSVGLRGGDETILLVEDEADVRQLLKDVLSVLGYKILIAQDGEEAVRISNDFAGTIHIMLVDVVMPKLNGLQAAREIFRQRPKTKVIFISGYTGDAELLHDIVSSGVSFIEKPFKSDFVAMKVRELLDSPDENLDEIDS